VLGRKPGAAPVVTRYGKKVRHFTSEGKSQRWITKEVQIDRKTVVKILSDRPC